MCGNLVLTLLKQQQHLNWLLPLRSETLSMCGLHKHQLGVWKSKAQSKEKDGEQNRERTYGTPQICGELAP